MSLTLNMHLDVSAGPNISIEQQLTNYIKGGGGGGERISLMLFI